MPPAGRQNGGVTAQRWDAIIAGGGTAGLVVGARLVEAGRRVLVVEAGPDYGPFDGGAWPPELLDSATIPHTHDWGYTSGADLPGRTLPTSARA
jgi:choline dehydrogenase